MLSLTSLAHGFAVSAALIIAIGAQNMFVLRQALRREHVSPIVLFCAETDAVLIGLGVAGLGALLGQAPSLRLGLSLGGAAFLGWYALGAFRRALAPGALVAERGAQALSLGGALAQAAGFTLLNPHVYLDTVLLVGSIGAAEPVGAQPTFVLGAALASVSWFCALGYGGRMLAPLFARPAAWKVLELAVGTTMLALALSLLLRAMQGD
jgi:L-lysine exporter family protein LysE/ArgO